MPYLKLTSKRQATLPADTCDALGVRPGDVVEIVARDEGGERLWILKPRQVRSRDWVGSLRDKVSAVGSHAMRDVRESIARGRAGERAGRTTAGKRRTTPRLSEKRRS